MGYVSNTSEDRAAMLKSIGIDQFSELLEPIPVSIQLNRLLDLPEPLDEYSLTRTLSELADKNQSGHNYLSFLGAGIYDHFRPAVVAQLSGRGEFSTSYTPYQPELSQGMLQTLYEFQTLMCALTGMDLANASMYDGATAIAEAALMAAALTGRKDVIIPSSIHPHYKQVLGAYLRWTGYNLRTIERLYDHPEKVLDENTACVIIQNPDFFGNLCDYKQVIEKAHSVGALAIVSADPISLGILKPPSEYDADIVVGEGQSLGSPCGFGGPLLGFFACKKKFLRHFPGRIVGATLDGEGRRGYTMTLRTREQDIRREKATSNICTNQTLLAVAATIYLSVIGKSGLIQAADLCLQKANYAKTRLCSISGVQPLFPDSKSYKEFALRIPISSERLNRELLKERIMGGYPLNHYFPQYGNSMLVCVTETKSRVDIDRFVQAVERIIQS